MFEANFLGLGCASRQAYDAAIHGAATTLLRAMPRQAYSGKAPHELAELFAGEICPTQGQSLEAVLRQAEDIVAHSILPSHPRTMAHLHCPPLIPGLAAEVLLSALNQSMDSFDQAPAATIIEQKLTRWLCSEAGLPSTAEATFTTGGTQSNYLGLLLARDHFLQSRWGWSAKEKGLPTGARRLRILCSEMAHFSVEKTALQLGLGTDAVVRVAVDEHNRLSLPDLQAKLAQLEQQGLLPMAIVATAGTTDFGAIDPLREIAAVAWQAGAWFHIDAAYGGALLFSARHRNKLAGLELADSIGIDFHKLFWQPIGCGVLLVRDAAHFEFIEIHADYLNPEEHEEGGIPDLVSRSLLTTRRFEALKIWMSLRVLGRDRLAAMIDRTLDLATSAAAHLAQHPRLELLHEPSLDCILFRYVPRSAIVEADRVNDRLRRKLFEEGRAVIGQTRIRGRAALKLTILNPSLNELQIHALLDEIAEQGVLVEESFHLPRTMRREGTPIPQLSLLSV